MSKTAKTRKPKRVYRLSDLVEIAMQLGGRIHLQLIPTELAEPPQKDAPERPDHPTKRPKRRAR